MAEVKTEKVYHAHNDSISVTFECRKEENFKRIKASFMEVFIANYSKIWSIKEDKGVWLLKIDVAYEGGVSRSDTEVAGRGGKEEAVEYLIKKIVGEFQRSNYINAGDLEEGLRRNLIEN